MAVKATTSTLRIRAEDHVEVVEVAPRGAQDHDLGPSRHGADNVRLYASPEALLLRSAEAKSLDSPTPTTMTSPATRVRAVGA